MKKREKIYDLARMLFDEDGEFEVTAPGGAVFRVNCQRGVGMAFTRLDPVTRTSSARWRVRRSSNQAAESA